MLGRIWLDCWEVGKDNKQKEQESAATAQQTQHQAAYKQQIKCIFVYTGIHCQTEQKYGLVFVHCHFRET